MSVRMAASELPAFQHLATAVQDLVRQHSDQ